jgi:hypothetical protein
MSVRLEREGEGRYTVMVGEHVRAGLVIGGKSKWCAEAPGGFVLGYFPSRAAAIEALVKDATEPTWQAMSLTSSNAMLPRSWTGDLDIDRAEVRRWAGSTDFLWMLRENGTNLMPLDVQWCREALSYRMELYDNERIPYTMFLVCARSQPGLVKKITPAKARELMARPARFAIDNAKRAIVQQPGGTVLGTFEVSGNAISDKPDAVVTVRLAARPAAADYPALIDAANQWLGHYAGTWFATPKTVRVLLDNEVLVDTAAGVAKRLDSSRQGDMFGPLPKRAKAYAEHFRGACCDSVRDQGGVDVSIYGIQAEDVEAFPELAGVHEAQLWDGGISFALATGRTVEMTLH